MTWTEAEQAMHRGQKVRRAHWKEGEYIYRPAPSTSVVLWSTGDEYFLLYSSRHASDWEVLAA